MAKKKLKKKSPNKVKTAKRKKPTSRKDSAEYFGDLEKRPFEKEDRSHIEVFGVIS